NRRIQGETYEHIAASGGGIASTVRATRAASEDQLVQNVLMRARTMARYGTTTAEAKSGYGLNVADEGKQLRAIANADGSSPGRLSRRGGAAHDFPPDGRAPSYVEEIINDILPAVAQGKLARFFDAFVEIGAFSPEQAERVLRAAMNRGFVPRLHADEFTD